MINKNEGKNSFKKFSDINSNKSVKGPSEENLEILPDGENRPANPNLPTGSTKLPKGMSTRSMMPLASEQDYDKSDGVETNEDKKVKLYGKVAKLPKGTKASKGFNFLENVKISKNSIWYIMVEKADNELQMVKYNYKKGVDLSKFINELKTYYISKNKNNKFVCEAISKISIDGNDKYSYIKNIPLVEMDGKKIVTKITEDLIKLLSK